MSDLRLIVVVGATGVQGRGVVEQLLRDKENRWAVRALTRDAKSFKSKELLSQLQTNDNRLSLAVAHVHDASGLDTAFAGAYGVFGMTSNQKEPGELLMTEDDLRHEVVAGRNMINAVKKNGVKHFVFSGLPDIIKGSNGKFKGAINMNNKVEIEQIARRELDGYTGIIPGNFFTNLSWPMYTRRQSDGSVRFCDPIGAEKGTQWLDGGRDIGLFVTRIFALGVEKTKNKNYIAGGKLLSVNDIMKTFTGVTGKKAYYDPITYEEFADTAAALMGPAFRQSALEMKQWAGETPEGRINYGCSDPEEDISAELGVTVTGLEEWLRETGFIGGAESS